MSDDTSDFARFAVLPDEQKRELCIQLLTEFGVDSWRETVKGELQHNCSLPTGGHTDGNSMTASINYRKLTFRCLVCNARGGLIWWIGTNRKESSEDAWQWLEKTSGVSDVLDLPLLLKVLQSLADQHKPEVLPPLPSFSPQTLQPWSYERWGLFHPYLTDPWHPDPAQSGREIPEQTLAQYRIGYCDEDTDWHYYQRIIIPLFWRDNLVGWQARRLWRDDPIKAKYKNSPEFPRDRVLYGDLEHRDVVVVESPMSVLRHGHHLPLVATLGAGISPAQVPLLHRYRRVTLWYDPDPAGVNAIVDLAQQLQPYCEVMVVQSPYAKVDPADMTESDAADLVADAVPFVLWRKPVFDQLIQYQREVA